MQTPHKFLLLAILVGTTALADTVTLTTGEKLEGKILQETADQITIAVKISAGVTDEQIVPKANIAKIDKEQPDELAWQSLKGLKPAANSLQAAQYENVLRPLQAFVNEYPQSAHAAEANQLLALFSGEKSRVEAGEVRLGEKWLSAEEVGKERYQINAQVAVAYLRSQRQSGDLIGALNSFDLIEKTYPEAQIYADAVEVARETLASLKATVDRAQKTFLTQKAEFEAGLANAGPAQKAELLAARQRELAQGEAALTAADKAKLKWPAIVTRSDKNLDAIAKKIPAEVQRLSAIDLAKLRQAALLAERARKEIREKDPAASETLVQALALVPNNELARRLQPEALAMKMTAAAEAQAIARATPEPTPRATPRPREIVADVPQVEPEKPFFLTIGGIITIIVVLGIATAGWMVFNKIRHRANDVLE
jgi:hypothetical protein